MDYNNLYYFITTKSLNSHQIQQALVLSPYNFEIVYYLRKINPIDTLSYQPNYSLEVGYRVEDLLPTFQNKIRGTLIKSLSIQIIGNLRVEVAIGYIIIAYINITIISIIARNKGEANIPTSRQREEYPYILRGDTQEQYQGDATIISIEVEAYRSQAIPRIYI